MGYYYVTLDVVMRDCDSPVDAVRQMARLLPQHPDETTQHMESWSVEVLRSPKGEHYYHRRSEEAEKRLEILLDMAENPADYGAPNE